MNRGVERVPGDRKRVTQRTDKSYHDRFAGRLGRGARDFVSTMVMKIRVAKKKRKNRYP
jgi:hypothetical protein